MKIVNMSHRLSDEAIGQIATMTGCPPLDIQEFMISVQVDFDAGIAAQLEAIFQEFWKEGDVDLYIPPALSFVATYVGAALANALCFPGMIVMKGVGVPRRFVVAEIVE